MTKAQNARFQPFARRTVLILICASAFVILGLVGLRFHSAELGVTFPVVTELQSSTNGTDASVAPHASAGGSKEVNAPGDLQSTWHLDLLTICVLTLMAIMVLRALFGRHPWRLPRSGRTHDLLRSPQSPPLRPRPLLLLLSISRT